MTYTWTPFGLAQQRASRPNHAPFKRATSRVDRWPAAIPNRASGAEARQSFLVGPAFSEVLGLIPGNIPPKTSCGTEFETPQVYLLKGDEGPAEGSFARMGPLHLEVDQRTRAPLLAAAPSHSTADFRRPGPAPPLPLNDLPANTPDGGSESANLGVGVRCWVPDRTDLTPIETH